MSGFTEIMIGMAGLSDEQMARPWQWRPDGEEDLQIRDAFPPGIEPATSTLGGRVRRPKP
jgi:hypothetical protein